MLLYNQLLCYDNSNYYASTIHSPIYSVNNIFYYLNVILVASLEFLLRGMDV